MNNRPKDPLSENLAGIQLALFEVVWPGFTWIKGIYAAAGPTTCFIHVVADELPSDAEWDDCVRLLDEIFGLAAEVSESQLKAVCNESAPADAAFKEFMSQAIFELIARDRAPWRLPAGR